MQRFNILVGVIPTFDGKILLTRRSMLERFLPGTWGLTCGKVDFGETLEHAVARELLEETGLKVGQIRKMSGYSMFMSKKGDDDLHNLQINFLVDVITPEPVILDKSSDSYKWIAIDEYEQVALDEFTVATIRQAFEGTDR